MTKCTRMEAQLLLAGIRVLTHLNNCLPNANQLADFLNLPDSSVRLKCSLLVDLGAMVNVESAFESHLDVGDIDVIRELPEDDGPSITQDLNDFDKRKEEEAQRLAHLFDSGEHDKQKQRKMEKMDDDLMDFRKKKPVNPFGDI